MGATGKSEDAAPPVAAADWALFLDIDGTLLDLAATPDAVEIPPGLAAALGAAAAALGGALAVVSGRSIDWIDGALAPLRLPAAGQHGAELRTAADGAVRRLAVPAGLDAIRRRVVAAAAAWPGVVVEDKGRSLAVHYRQAPERADDVQRLLSDAAAGGGPFQLQPGKMVLELKPAGSTKGRVVAALMEVPPFAGRTPVFVGDDRTDEDGFREAMARGGIAVQVGPSRSAVASHRIADPAALRDWLRGLPATVRGAAA